ncbi:MAG: CNNM domain-containing protein, partial [Pseudomonadota bacterium]|nr:CNNM domain-containing protein [Pseudomonadota bacterium]
MNDDVPLGLLFGLLIVLLFFSAFFSGTETALMRLNRFRLRSRARSGDRAARLAETMLQRPDRLIGLILLGQNVVNLAAAALTTLIALRLGGESAIWVGTAILTLVILIFAEAVPKTFAAYNPSLVALPASLVYYPMLKVAYPLIWLINLAANSILRLLGQNPSKASSSSLRTEELRTLLREGGAVPERHQNMLLSVLDLGETTVDDVMVPRQEILGIDLDEPWKETLLLIKNSQHTCLPVFQDDVDNIKGLVRISNILEELSRGTLDEPRLLENLEEPYFVPEGTPLNKQLFNFQNLKNRFAFVVDEYGDVQGLITTEDIVREIVGEFGADPGPTDVEITKDSERSYVVDASANVRQLNRLMSWNFPTDGPKTLNGLIVEQLETIPNSGTGVTVADYPIEILSTTEHGIKKVRVFPPSPQTESELQLA